VLELREYGSRTKVLPRFYAEPASVGVARLGRAGSVTNDARIMSLAVRAAQAIHVGVLLAGPSTPKSYVVSTEFVLRVQR
jgi:hypothetical protein